VIENVSEHNANVFKEANKKYPKQCCPFLREFGCNLVLVLFTVCSILWVLWSSYDMMIESKDLLKSIGKFEDFDKIQTKKLASMKSQNKFYKKEIASGSIINKELK